MAQRLDRFAAELHSTGLPKLQDAGEQLLTLAANWIEWCEKQGANAFAATALETSKAVLDSLPEANKVSFRFHCLRRPTRKLWHGG